MNTEEFKRRLTAILSADVEGYSRLMREDEEATIRTLKAYRTAMRDLIRQYRGRVVDSPGDNILAEFASVLDAVNCAVEIQRELAERNTELPENRRMQFRIGVNLGDIVEDGERIYGDGVNIAARMESLAEGGGICISGKVYEEVKHKLGLEYEYQGEQEVKNIAEPVPAYRVLSFPGAAAHRVVKAKRAVGRTWRNVVVAIAAVLVLGAAVAVWHFYFRPPSVEVASVERMAFPLPDKPSIAVLPFVNISGDPEQEYFSDGLTEEIISALSKVPKLFVIARNSTFTYKGKPVKVQQVSEELGVRYVLEGGVRKAEDRVRITVQLIDALTGHHLWSERYDRELKDIFALQDEITMKVLTELQVKLTDGEAARLRAKGAKNLQAYLKLLRAREHWLTQTKEDNALARRLLEEVIALDPEYSLAYVYLGGTHWMEIWLKSSKSPKASLERAFELTKKALTLDDSSPEAHGHLGWLYTLTRQYEKGIAECERALALHPSSHSAHIWLGYALRFAGRYEEAVRHNEQALRLNPIPSGVVFRTLGISYTITERYDEAITALKKALIRTPNDILAHVGLAAAYSLAGRMEEAQAEAEQVLKIDPKYSLEYLSKRLTYKDKAIKDRYINALRKAGIPDKPPLPLPDKPSIAVLPFVNMSDDPKQEYFSDGLTEEIITALSKTPKLFVIARNSTFTYKGKPVKVQQVGRELGVKYVLEGSVRKAEDKVRITAQLVDAQSGRHLWAERYDRDLKDVFAVQDEITKKILTELRVKLTDGEQARFAAKGTENLQAYLKLLQALPCVYRLTRDNSIRGRQLCAEAIALDPDFPDPYVAMGWFHIMDWRLGWSKSRRVSMERALELAKKALDLDETLGSTHGLLAYIYRNKRQYEKAVAEAEKEMALSPNSAAAHWHMAQNLYPTGRPEEAIVLIKKAMRLNPVSPWWYFYGLGQAYWTIGQYEEAIAAYRKAVHVQPDNLLAHIGLTTTYSSLGREEEASAEAAEVLRIRPKFSVDYISKTLPFKNQADTARYVEGLRKAGLK